ncbi:MAG: hypothetical protein KTR21_04325 [Rhodobacteraceae bacterium]|nr:hypothetical protein [Paracoccaceae bacterium]
MLRRKQDKSIHSRWERDAELTEAARASLGPSPLRRVMLGLGGALCGLVITAQHGAAFAAPTPFLDGEAPATRMALSTFDITSALEALSALPQMDRVPIWAAAALGVSVMFGMAARRLSALNLALPAREQAASMDRGFSCRLETGRLGWFDVAARSMRPASGGAAAMIAEEWASLRELERVDALIGRLQARRRVRADARSAAIAAASRRGVAMARLRPVSVAEFLSSTHAAPAWAQGLAPAYAPAEAVVASRNARWDAFARAHAAAISPASAAPDLADARFEDLLYRLRAIGRFHRERRIRSRAG